MGYYLQTFIGRKEDLQLITDNYSDARLINLDQGISIIPMTAELFDQINNLKTSDDIGSFEYMTTNIETEILNKIGNNTIAYIEAEYFGGNGGQIGIIWKDKQRFQQYTFGQEVINKILRYFGVVTTMMQDEFSTLGLGRHRNTKDWLESFE